MCSSSDRRQAGRFDLRAGAGIPWGPPLGWLRAVRLCRRCAELGRLTISGPSFQRTSRPKVTDHGGARAASTFYKWPSVSTYARRAAPGPPQKTESSMDRAKIGLEEPDPPDKRAVYAAGTGRRQRLGRRLQMNTVAGAGASSHHPDLDRMLGYRAVDRHPTALWPPTTSTSGPELQHTDKRLRSLAPAPSSRSPNRWDASARAPPSRRRTRRSLAVLDRLVEIARAAPKPRDWCGWWRVGFGCAAPVRCVRARAVVKVFARMASGTGGVCRSRGKEEPVARDRWAALWGGRGRGGAGRLCAGLEPSLRSRMTGPSWCGCAGAARSWRWSVVCSNDQWSFRSWRQRDERLSAHRGPKDRPWCASRGVVPGPRGGGVDVLQVARPWARRRPSGAELTLTSRSGPVSTLQSAPTARLGCAPRCAGRAARRPRRRWRRTWPARACKDAPAAVAGA